MGTQTTLVFAFKSASGLIENMDFVQLYGEDFDAPDEELAAAQSAVVRELNIIALRIARTGRASL